MPIAIPSDEMLKRAKDTVDEFIAYASPERSKRIGKVENLYKNYAVSDTKGRGDYRGRAHCAVPMSHEGVEAIVPRFVEILMQNGVIKFELEPVGMEDEPFVDASNALIKHDLKKAKARQKVLEACRAVVKWGTIVYETPWWQDIRSSLQPKYSYEQKGVAPDGSPIYREKLDGYEKTDRIVHEGVGLNYVPMKAVYVDPFEPDVQKAQGIVVETTIPLEDLKREKLRIEVKREQNPMSPTGSIYIERTVGHYFNLEGDNGLEQKLKVGTTVKEQSDGVNQPRDQTDITPRKKANVRQYFGRFINDSGQEGEYVIAIAEEDIVIRCQVSELPERPYLLSRFIPVEGQTYGLGMLELLDVPQKTINDVLNQTLDNVTKILLNMWLCTNPDITDDKMVYGPDRVIHGDSIEDLTPLRPEMVTQKGWEAIGVLTENSRHSFGFPQVLSAKPMKYHTTATEVSSMATEALARIVIGVITFEEEFIGPLLKRIIEFNHAFMGQEKLIRITNDQTGQKSFAELTPEDIAGQFDYTPLGSTSYQRKVHYRQEISQFLMAMAQLLSVPPEILMQTGIDIGLFLREIAKYHDIPNMEYIFPDKQQQGQGQPQGEQEMLAQAVAAMQEAGGVQS